MNILPQILRENKTTTVYRRQGPFYNLKLDNSFRMPAASSERSSAKMKNRLKVNRYSIDKGELEARRTVNYSTISYDHRNDPEFYGTKGKFDQIESYQILIQERQREADAVAIKVAAFRGTKQAFEEEYHKIETQFNEGLTAFQAEFTKEITNLRQYLSDLRRQTQLQIKSFKQDIKHENESLLVYCEEIKRVDNRYKKFKESLENI